MKKKAFMRRSTDVIAYVSLAITLISVLWNTFFGYGNLVGKIDALQENFNEFKISVDKRFDKVDARFDKIENRLERIDDNFHKLDVRVTTIEQQKR
jgi:hypothetical protein